MDLTPSNRNQHLNKLRTELVRRGLPRAYINRLLSELDDHCTDLVEERNSHMGAARKLQFESDDPQQRLGESTQLAVFAADQYHSRTFWGRHPLVTYLLGPLPLLVLCWFGFGLALWGVFTAIGLAGQYVFGLTDKTFEPLNGYLWLQVICITLVSWYVVVLPPFAAAWLLCRTYRRNALDWRWPVLGCALLAIASALFTVSHRLPTEPGNGSFTVGFYAAASFSWFFLIFVPKFSLALGIGLLLIQRAHQKLQLEATL